MTNNLRPQIPAFLATYKSTYLYINYEWALRKRELFHFINLAMIDNSFLLVNSLTRVYEE